MREGCRMLHAAIENEIADYIERFKHEKDPRRSALSRKERIIAGKRDYNVKISLKIVLTNGSTLG